MNYDIQSSTIKEQVKVHTTGTIKIVIRVTAQGRRSFFDEYKEVRVYTRTLVLDDNMKIKRVFEDSNGDCWWTDVDRAKRLADRYGKREGQRVVLVDTKDEELAEALRELERVFRRRSRPSTRTSTTPSTRRSSRTSTGAVVGAIIGTIIGGAIGAAGEK